MPTLTHNQEVLLTRQRHEADRAGLHYDYRIVVGDKAYSWATKMEMPKLGETQLLFEQPVHTAGYALSKKVVIPKGQYGAGVTTLDWVKRGKIRNQLEKPDQFSIVLRNKHRLFFKKLPEKYGDSAWLFRHLPPKPETPLVAEHGGNKYLEKSASYHEDEVVFQDMFKEASLLLGGALTHLAQNAATKAALGSKHISKYLANSFAEGSKGVVNTSVKSRAARLLAGATVPDIAVAHKKFHELGGALKPFLEGATKKQKVGLRMLSEGRVGDLHKYKLHKDPLVQRASTLASKSLNLPELTHSSTMGGKAVEKIFADKSHPLASNILKNISRGKAPIGSNYKPGVMSSKTPLLGSVGSALVDPAGGALNTAKTLTSSKKFNNTRIGAKVNAILENQFVKKPVKSGLELSKNNGVVSKIKHKVSEILVNPVSAQLKRTSAALSDALKS